LLHFFSFLVVQICWLVFCCCGADFDGLGFMFFSSSSFDLVALVGFGCFVLRFLSWFGVFLVFGFLIGWFINFHVLVLFLIVL
jgi:hypothetical protein